MSQHVNREESKNAINSIFPPSYFGYGQKVLDQIKGDDEANYNNEIEGLLRKYSAQGNYKNYGSKEALEERVGYGMAKNLKTEMAQAMKDIQ